MANETIPMATTLSTSVNAAERRRPDDLSRRAEISEGGGNIFVKNGETNYTEVKELRLMNSTMSWAWQKASPDTVSAEP